MFFIVFFLEAVMHKVVPHTWIHGLSEQLEKFINFGLNKNQKFMAFYTDSADAFDDNGVPRPDFVPDFNLSHRNNFPAEGLYLCKLVKFRGKFYFSSLFQIYTKLFIPSITYSLVFSYFQLIMSSH